MMKAMFKVKADVNEADKKGFSIWGERALSAKGSMKIN